MTIPLENLKPIDIVRYLDEYIIGQNAAKKSVAVAIRNRVRRRRVGSELQDEIYPKNIIMIGPTGVGKTEIARRLAKLVQAPFLKIEASKYTETGYVGRDVESMIRDLVEIGINMQRRMQVAECEKEAILRAEERILDILLPGSGSEKSDTPFESFISTLSGDKEEESGESKTSDTRDFSATRSRFRKMLREGKLNGQEIEIEVKEKQNSFVEVFSSSGIEEMGFNVQNMMGNLFPDKKQNKSVTVDVALEIFTAEEGEKLIDQDKMIKQALENVQINGIIFVDEIDKICGATSKTGPDVSREGVQRDILPIVEGTTVVTKYGPVKTDHILFIAAGAFHVSSPSDLIPELQGRFPIRVELDELTAEDFFKILKDPANSIIKQYQAMVKTEEVELEFEDSALREISEVSHQLNVSLENIGARRLHTVCEKVLENLLFELPDPKIRKVAVNALYVQDNIADILKDEDLSRYIL